MFRMNSEMLGKYNQLSFLNVELNHGLSEIIASGFEEKNGCFFLKECINIVSNVSVNNFPDKTGYECFINSINIDDYVQEDYLAQGIYFVQKVFHQWDKLKNNHMLIAILSLDDFGLKVKFHVQRLGESWLADELEDYEESILMVDSSDTHF